MSYFYVFFPTIYVQDMLNVISGIFMAISILFSPKFPVLLVSQIFGLFPLEGLASRHHGDIRFKWCSVRTVFSLTLLFASFATAASVMYNQSKLGPLGPANIGKFKENIFDCHHNDN